MEIQNLLDVQKRNELREWLQKLINQKQKD